MFWPTDPIPRVGGGGSVSASKIFATMLVHSWFSLIWYVTWPCSEKVNFDLFDPIHRIGGVGGGVYGQNICYHFSAFVILINLICIMTVFWKSWILTFWPHPLSLGGTDTGLRSKITFDMFLIFCTSVWMRNFRKHLTTFWVTANFKYSTFDPT